MSTDLVLLAFIYMVVCLLGVCCLYVDKHSLRDALIKRIKENGFQLWHLCICLVFAGVFVFLLLGYIGRFLIKHILKPAFTFRIWAASKKIADKKEI